MSCNLPIRWQEKNWVRPDRVSHAEIVISEYLSGLKNLYEKKLLHIGIGSSYVYRIFDLISRIDGIAVADDEIKYGKKLNKGKN